VLPDSRGVQRARDPKGPWERSALVSQVDAREVGVHGGSSTGQAPKGIDGEDTVHHHDTQQGWLRVADPAAHAGAHRALERGRLQLYS
jgi:hypothetical protein